MKAKNGLLLFTISLILVSCFEAPQFSDTPKIKFENVYFGKAKRPDQPDSLVINLSFEDGNGDLGLDNSYQSAPFHNYDYYVATTDGQLLPVSKNELVPGYFELNIPQGTSGKLAVVRTSKTAPFDQSMVPYGPLTSCTNYSRLDPITHVDSIVLHSSWSSLVDGTYDYHNAPDPSYLVVRDTFYTSVNPNFYNIDVHFLRKVSSGEYEEFDFTAFCPLSFNGRFPVLTDKENRPMSGDITYAMSSSAIEAIMGNNIWKLRVVVRDRALNESKAVESKEFTLEEIKK